LGPGMLSRIYDGLQNDLEKFDALFLKRGQHSDALASESRWHFKPLVKKGKHVHAADWLGEVKENAITHRIMVPFKASGAYKVDHIVDEGEYGIHDVIAVLINDKERIDVTMTQTWPVKKPIKAY